MKKLACSATSDFSPVSCKRFRYASKFITLRLAHKLNSLVRVTRREAQVLRLSLRCLGLWFMYLNASRVHELQLPASRFPKTQPAQSRPKGHKPTSVDGDCFRCHNRIQATTFFLRRKVQFENFLTPNSATQGTWHKCTITASRS